MGYIKEGRDKLDFEREKRRPDNIFRPSRLFMRLNTMNIPLAFLKEKASAKHPNPDTCP